MMLIPVALILSFHLILARSSDGHAQQAFEVDVNHGAAGDRIPISVREYWMRETNKALFTLQGPCPFGAFGSIVVNHTASGENGFGELVCMGANNITKSGNPTLHGETAAINNCSEILTDPNGRYQLSPKAALRAFRELSIYTNGESCPMCASAIRWAGFKEYIYGTTVETLFETGWDQISISSSEIFDKAEGLPGTTLIVPEILTNETDPLFSWQYDRTYPCPEGCRRSLSGHSCIVSR